MIRVPSSPSLIPAPPKPSGASSVKPALSLESGGRHENSCRSLNWTAAHRARFSRRKFLLAGGATPSPPLSSLGTRGSDASTAGPRRDRGARDLAEHRLARRRSWPFQKARDRYDLAGHRGRGAGGSGWAYSRRLGVRPYRHRPIAEEVLKGRDIVILATPTVEFSNSFIMTRKEITELAQLTGKKVGVLTETGQTSVAARITIEKAGAKATYLPLIKFDRIYAALAAGEIDAGALSIDLRFSGQSRYGWNAFPIDEFGTPSIFATTRRLIAADRELVMNVMQGSVETIHLFKTRPDIVVPLLQRYLKIEDRKAAEALYAFHVPLFLKVPSPLFPGMEILRDFLAQKNSAATTLKESIVAHASFLDELSETGSSTIYIGCRSIYGIANRPTTGECDDRFLGPIPSFAKSDTTERAE